MAMIFPEIDPVALSIGPFDIRWYALAYLCGFLAGWRYGLHLAGLNGATRPNREDIDDFLPWAVMGVILGGRMGYVVFYQFDYFLTHPVDIFKVWEGGMSFHGGVIGIIGALVVFSILRKIYVLRLSDIVCAAAPIGLFLGRIANFVNGELYGRVTDSPLGMVFPGAGPLPRHPSQIYEALLEGLVLFCVLFALTRVRAVRERPGIVTGVFLSGYALCRMAVEFVREPDAHLGLFWGSISMGQALSVPMALLGLCVLGYALFRPAHDPAR